MSDLSKHAPERVSVKQNSGYEINSWDIVTHPFDERGVEYIRADIHDEAISAIETRVWNEAIEAAAVRMHKLLADCAEANKAVHPSYARDMEEWADDALTEIRALRRPTQHAHKRQVERISHAEYERRLSEGSLSSGIYHVDAPSTPEGKD